MAINEGHNELIFSINPKEQKKEEKTIIIEAENKGLDMLKTEIVAAYLNNFTTIEIIEKKLLTNAVEIKNILRNLAGLEIMEQTSTKIVAKDLINVDDISVNNLIRRMDMIARAMIEDAVLCLDKKCDYRDIEHRDIDVNRLYYLGSRVIKNAMTNPVLAKNLGIDSWKLHSNLMLISRIEEIADRQKRISRFLSQVTFDNKTLEELKNIYRDFKDAYLNVMKAYYTNDKALAYKIEVENKARITACDNFLEKTSKCVHIKKRKPDVCSINLAERAKAVEYLKAMSTFIKHIARAVIGSH